MSRIKTIIATVMTVIMTSFAPVVLSNPVSAAAASVTCPTGSVRSTAASLAECNVPEDADGKGLMNTVQLIINVALSVLGVVTVIVIIVGGVTYITSYGDAGKVKKAKDTIMYGVIGLVVALLAFAIVNFVLGGIF